MLIEIIKDAYDVHGQPIMQPVTRRKRKVFHPSYPMKRFLTNPLQVHCASLEEIRLFLRGCKYVSDREQFNKADYWLPPEEFEQCRKGDCEDFALWAWRQLLSLKVPCRFVVGESGRYGEGHAWLTLEMNEHQYLMECQASCLKRQLPRLSMVRYKPEISVAFDGKKVNYFKHEEKSYSPTFVKSLPLALEWLALWTWFWTRILVRLPLLPYYITRNKQKRRLAQQTPSNQAVKS